MSWSIQLRPARCTGAFPKSAALSAFRRPLSTLGATRASSVPLWCFRGARVNVGCPTPPSANFSRGLRADFCLPKSPPHARRYAIFRGENEAIFGCVLCSRKNLPLFPPITPYYSQERRNKRKYIKESSDVKQLPITYDKNTNSFVWQSPEVEAATIQLWEKAYPSVDIEAEMSKMKVWLSSNPRKAQKKNWLRFCSAWISRSASYGAYVAGGRFRERNVADCHRQKITTPAENLEFSARW